MDKQAKDQGAPEIVVPETQSLTRPPCEGLPREMLDTGLPEHVFERMDFLWRASHSLRVSSPVLSRIYSDQLRSLCEEQDSAGSGVLPEWIRESMCGDCGGVLAPGVNCRVRVRHRSLASPSVKKAASSKRLKKCRNEVVTTCLLCGRVNARGGTERRAHDRNRRKAFDGGGGSDRVVKGDYATPKPRTRVADNLRGNFIPLGTSGSSAASPATTTPRPPRSSHRRAAQQKKRGNFPAAAGSGSKGAADSGGNKNRNRGGGGGGGVRSLPSPAGSGDVAGGDLEGKGGYRGVRSPLLGPASAGVGGRSGNSAGGQGGSVAEPGEPRSLLETIKKDAKRKRRQQAAAAAAATGDALGGR